MESSTSGFAHDSCLHAMFEASVLRAPGAKALVDGGGALTYAELDSRAEAVARRLRALGVGPGAVVGLVARRSADAVAALLGVLKAGAAYCPLDPAYPLERLRFMLEDSGAAALVTGREDAVALSATARPTLIFDDQEELDRTSPGPAPSAVGATDPAYVIYTSGSTGKPKGVIVEHGAAVDLIRAISAKWGTNSSDRMLLFASLSFDASVDELFSGLCFGATLVLRDEAMPIVPLAFLQVLEDREITVLDLPTAYWHELSAALAPLGKTLPPSIRLVATGGEALRAESLALWRPSAGRARFMNLYGPTETVVECTVYEVPPDEKSSGLVPLGPALPGSILHVLDPNGRPVPDGGEGELHVGGRMARGYLNRPELTAERFVPDPFSGRPGARLYRTGDKVRRRADGVLEFFGRMDDQIKILGHRVELGEIDTVLAGHPAVGSCVTILREDVPGFRRLVSYAALRAGAAASPAELRGRLAERLPAPMVSSAVVILAALPLTPNGKVDRKALPPPVVPSMLESPTGEEKASAPLERRIRRIWEEVLGLSPIGLRDEFYSLGGNSLLAVRVMAAIEKIIGRRPPLKSLGKGATIESVAKALAAETRGKDGPLVRFGPEAGADPVFFVHPGLGGLYCRELSRAMPDRPVYLLMGLDIAKIDSIPTIEEIARRHVETIRQVSPRGPYRLGGYSIGSTIAYEIARQLEAAGERIPNLMLVAAPLDDSSWWWRAARRGVGVVGRILREDQAAMLDRFNLLGRLGQVAGAVLKRGGAARLREVVRRAFSRANGRGSILDVVPSATDFDETLKALLWAWAAYRPGPYRGSVTLIEVENRFLSRNAVEFRRLAPLAEEVRLPYDHDSIVTTHAAELGVAIGRLVHDAR